MTLAHYQNLPLYLSNYSCKVETNLLVVSKRSKRTLYLDIDKY